MKRLFSQAVWAEITITEHRRILLAVAILCVVQTTKQLHAEREGFDVALAKEREATAAV